MFLQQGSGKTLAFGIPVIDRILNCRKEAAEKADENSHRAALEEKENQEEVGEDEEVYEDSAESEEDMEISDADDEDAGEQDNSEAGNDDEETSEAEDEVDKDEEEDDEEDAKDDRPLYALVLTPTRELAFQIRDHLRSICQDTDIKVRMFFLLDLCCG